MGKLMRRARKANHVVAAGPKIARIEDQRGTGPGAQVEEGANYHHHRGPFFLFGRSCAFPGRPFQRLVVP